MYTYMFVFPQCSDIEVLWIMRLAVLVIGATACGIAIQVRSIYALFILCSDLVIVLLFPQLTCILYVAFTNTYGSTLEYFLGFFFRLTGGESLIGWAPLIEYPWFDAETGIQNFPFKTICMLLGFVGIIGGSWLFKRLFENQTLPAKADMLRKCFVVEETKKCCNLGVINLAYIVDDVSVSESANI